MSVLSPEFQTNLTKAILQDPSFLSRYRTYLERGMFKDETESDVVRHALEFYDQYSATPSRDSFTLYLERQNYLTEDIEELVHPLYDEPVLNIDFLEDSLKDFVKKTRIKDVLLESTVLLDKGEYDRIYDRIKNTVLSFVDGDVGDLFWKDKKKVLQELDAGEQFIPTGITSLDEKLGGGAVRKTLNVIVTPPNKGKSTSLVNVGKYAALAGFNVAHYTFELSANVIKRRYFMAMTRMSKKELKRKKATAYDKILDLADGIAEESIIVKRYPAYSCTVPMVREHINLVRNKYGFFPDVLIFDYADLMRSTKSYDQRRHELSEVYYTMRELADEFNAAAWTASQTNRSGASEELVTMEDLAECYEKAACADVMVSVNQTLDEKRSRPQTARLFLAKNRDDVSEVTVEVETDWERAWIGNLL